MTSSAFERGAAEAGFTLAPSPPVRASLESLPNPASHHPRAKTSRTDDRPAHATLRRTQARFRETLSGECRHGQEGWR